TSVRQPLLPEHAISAPLTQLLAGGVRQPLRDDDGVADAGVSATHLAFAELLLHIVHRLVEQPLLLALFFQPAGPGVARPSFPVFTALLDYIDAPGRIGVLAREGVLLVTLLALDDEALASYMTTYSAAPQLTAVKLAQ